MHHFLIASPTRSASTSLRLTVNSAKHVICHGEIFGQNRVLGPSFKIKRADNLTIELRRDDPELFFSQAFDPPGYDHTGFKALYGHFFLEQNQQYLEWFLARAPKVLFLWRTNLVARYLSECRKRMLRPDRPRPRRFAGVTVEDIVADARRQMRMARDIRARLAATPGCAIFDISFEQMITDPAVTEAAMAFLGLRERGYQIRKDKRTLRNEAAPPPDVPTPGSFSAPEVQRYTSVSIEEALAEAEAL